MDQRFGPATALNHVVENQGQFAQFVARTHFDAAIQVARRHAERAGAQPLDAAADAACDPPRYGESASEQGEPGKKHQPGKQGLHKARTIAEGCGKVLFQSGQLCIDLI